MEVYLRANDVLGSEAIALRSLNAPRPQLNDHSPLSVIDTGAGFDDVMHMFPRIEHGVYT